jgi:hypothetical protein
MYEQAVGKESSMEEGVCQMVTGEAKRLGAKRFKPGEPEVLPMKPMKRE